MKDNSISYLVRNRIKLTNLSHLYYSTQSLLIFSYYLSPSSDRSKVYLKILSSEFSLNYTIICAENTPFLGYKTSHLMHQKEKIYSTVGIIRKTLDKYIVWGECKCIELGNW